MTITTGMNPAMAAASCDMVYEADDFGLEVKCFMKIDAEYDAPDRSVGNFNGGWLVTADLIGCQIGALVLDKYAAHDALDGFVTYLERVAAEAEASRLEDAA